ncbi:MAG: ABC transporter ATP-binding protein/permease, partial [Pirellulales bacterium]|nr:ABC transporter ATP-binding protein/permease [Pirellulales bacterium]
MLVPLVVGLVVDALSGRESSIFGISVLNQDLLEVATLAGVALASIAAFRGLAAYGYSKLGGLLNQRFVAGLRRRLAQRAVSLPLSDHAYMGSGEMLDRVLHDTSKLRTFIDCVFIRTCSNILRIGYPLVMMVLISPLLSVIAFAPIGMLWLISLWLQRRLHQVASEELESRGDMTTAAKESFDNIETVQALQAEEERGNVFDSAADRVETLERKMHHLSGMTRACTLIFTGFGFAVVWGVGARLVATGSLTIGTLIIFGGLTQFAYRPFRYFARMAKTYQKGMASLQRVCSFLDKPDVEVKKKPVRSNEHKTDCEGRIGLDAVEFGYGDKTILEDLHAEIEPNSFTAIVGRSGCGKTTLLRIMCGLY